ncbi:MAG: hypothetical protein HRF49_00585 [bacterium]|jgi:hypothetical protein
MKSAKDFDCVQMKWDIQKRIAEETKGMSEADAQKYLWQKVLDNPNLGPIVKKMKRYRPLRKVGS